MTEHPTFEVPAAIASFVTLQPPDKAEPPILAPLVRTTVFEWLVEIGCVEELADVVTPCRRSALLVGPPGTGKTTLASHIAARLGLPFLTVNSSAVTEMWIGATGQNLAVLFRWLCTAADECVVLFDEFDTLATARGDGKTGAGREFNNIVNAVLQNMDLYKGVLLAASNRPDVLDEAIWRRFDLQLDINIPAKEERFAILRRYLLPFVLPDEDMDVLTEVTEGATPALIRKLMEGVKRDLILGPRFKRPPFPRAVFERQAAAIGPHPDAPKPPLWSEGAKAFDKIAKISWPPERLAKTPTQEQAA